MTQNNTPPKQRTLSDLSVYLPYAADISPFSAFLEYTTEKDQVSNYLGEQLAVQLSEAEKGVILDIGAGDSSLALGAIIVSGLPLWRIDYHAIEPVAFNVERARANLAALGLPGTIQATTFQEFVPDHAYDVVIASNLYFIALEEIPDFIRQAKAALAPGGKLFFAYRAERDDLLDFRYRFEAPLYQPYRRPRTIGDVLSVCSEQNLAEKSAVTIDAILNFPDDRQMTEKIIEFILNRPPERLPQGYHAAINGYLQERSNKLITRQTILTFE